MSTQKTDIPVISAAGNSLPAAWEQSLIELTRWSLEVPTDYDQSGDPPALDSAMVITVMEPLEEPRIHRIMPTGEDKLFEYVHQVMHGTDNHHLEQGKVPYTYHNRLCQYKNDNPSSYPELGYDQIRYIVDTLANNPRSRRAQAITWIPEQDMNSPEPPCLQSIHCRLIEGEGDRYSLNMNVRFRSNDAYKAAFMNMFMLTELQRDIAREIGRKWSDPEAVDVGRCFHLADSYHIYGKDRSEFEKTFLRALENRSFAERTYRTK